MALQKQGFNINFAQGLDLKTDPFQVPAGKFLVMENAVFNTGSSLEKRKGFPNLTQLPTDEQTNLTTLNDNLIATGMNLYAYSNENDVWYNQGAILPTTVRTLPLVRNNTAQTNNDSSVSSNGLVCSVFSQSGAAYYQINDSVTGQNIVNATLIAATASNARVFILGRYFFITFCATVSASPHLQYIAIPISTPTNPSAATDISTAISAITAGYDGVVANNTLYLAWNGNDGGGAIRVLQISSTLTVSATKIISTYSADLVSITADITTTTPTIWVSWWLSSSGNAYTTALDASRVTTLAPTAVFTSITVTQITSSAQNNINTFLYQTTNNYSYASIRSDFVSYKTITLAGAVGSATVVQRSVGLASKSFLFNGVIYALVVYGGAYQPTYFLVNLSGSIFAKLAYSNGGGYITGKVLPKGDIINDEIIISYLFKSQLVSVNKAQGVTAVGGIYAPTGVNLAKFTLNQSKQYSAEIAQSLHLTGGYVWQYDAVKPVEHGFHLWPEDLTTSISATGGSISQQQYYYIFCYEWTDAQGLLHRSAPSIPVGANVTTGAGAASVTINVPTLRLTQKDTPNAIRLVGYRWSTAQQSYYQFTSITSPNLNSKTVDSLAIVDTLADASILGNTLLYTTGGVVENIAAPSCYHSTLFKDRMFVIDSENRNLVWYSKQVVQGVPVEFSDLFTIYVASTTSTQTPTGELIAASAMDDKLILFKRNAIYYVNGNGPDNTGANNDFSEPVFITSTVGCNNPSSIVFTPQGIMFQSDKGIWLLGRDLSTRYIGADVAAYNNDVVNSALTIPGTNEVRFSLDGGTVLMYDYYYAQWGTFTGVPAVSSVLYNDKHTYLNASGQIRQQSNNSYLDGTQPVLLKVTTSWLKMTNLQGFQRAYCMYLLSTYVSPHKVNVSIAYDYNNSPTQLAVISPTNMVNLYGSDTLYGGSSPYGGTSNLEQWRVFFNRQKCQALQLTLQESYDPSQGVAAGAGLIMSGINIVIGGKLTYPKLTAKESTS